MNYLALKVQIMGMTFRMAAMIQHIVIHELGPEKEGRADPSVVFLVMYATTMGNYAKTAMTILNTPTEVQPIMGKRCIFY